MQVNMELNKMRCFLALTVFAVFTFSLILKYNHFFATVKWSIVSQENGTKDIYIYGTYDEEIGDVACSRLLSGDVEYIANIPHHWRVFFHKDYLINQSCRNYRSIRGFITSAMTGGEEHFPIAFSILVYKDFPQVERLLRAVWRPHNIYCINVDAKSSDELKSQIKSLASCFSNVILQPKSVNVIWGTYTVLEPEILCMKELWRSRKRWKYFINLTGQEFPLKTNYELYQILKSFAGANDIEGAFYNEPNWNYRWTMAGQPPYNITPVKSTVHIVASRPFVDYVLHSNVSISLLKWLKPTIIPDETFFSSLNYNPHLKVPGAPFDDGKYHSSWLRYKIWETSDTKCDGKFIRQICIFSVGDLPRLIRSRSLFANKFLYDYQPLAYDCLEGWYHNKVQAERDGRLDFNASIYGKTWVAKHHF